MLCDKCFNPDPTAENKPKRRGIKLGRTSPVAQRADVKGHQVGQPNFNLVHGEPYDAQRSAMIDERKGGLLAGPRSRAFENDPLGLTQASLLGEGLNRSLDFADVELARI